MNSEFEQLICKFYDLSCEEKKAEIFNEIKKMNDLLKKFSSLNNDPIKNKFVPSYLKLTHLFFIQIII